MPLVKLLTQMILYFIAISIREFFIILIAFKGLLITLNKFNSMKITTRNLILLAPLLSFLFLILINFNLLLFLTGWRFYILLTLPLLIADDQKSNDFKFNIKVNDFIFYFYLFLNAITLIIGLDAYEYIGQMDNLLGHRFPFIFQFPNLAAQQFGIMLLYANFRLSFSKSLFVKTSFIFSSIILLIFSFYTGGRAGISMSLVIVFSSLICFIFPKIKYIFKTPKLIINKIFLLIVLITIAMGSVFLSSNRLISGRYVTELNIKNEGLVSGLYGSRFGLMQEAFLKKEDFENLLVGKPGFGTNTACIGRISPRTEDICFNTDSLITTSLTSFGIIGIVIYFTLVIYILNYAYSPLVLITFFVFSLSQIFPEIIFPWIQFVIILLLSIQKSNFEKLKV